MDAPVQKLPQASQSVTPHGYENKLTALEKPILSMILDQFDRSQPSVGNKLLYRWNVQRRNLPLDRLTMHTINRFQQRIL